MWKTLLLVAVIASHLGTGQSERNATTNVFTQQWWKQVQQEQKNELTRVREECSAAIDAVDCEECQRRKYLGKQWKYPAWSCAEIAERRPDYTNGYYWIQGDGWRISRGSGLAYCDLETKFSLGEKGWQRVANFNITDPNQQCPTGFQLITEPKQLCIRDTEQPGCSSVHSLHSLNTYRLVCGTVGAYRFKTTDGFNCPPHCTINEPYVDGVSITHDRYKPKHIWTIHSQDQCNNVIGRPPQFVGNSYSCQSYTPVSFCRQLLNSIDDQYRHLEVRVCRDHARYDEDIHLEFIELYVQ